MKLGERFTLAEAIPQAITAAGAGCRAALDCERENPNHRCISIRPWIGVCVSILVKSDSDTALTAP